MILRPDAWPDKIYRSAETGTSDENPVNTAFVALVLLAAAGVDDASPFGSVQVVGACPARPALLQALAPALGPGGQDAARGRGEPIRVVDLGDRYEVAAAGQNRRYADADRDCDER